MCYGVQANGACESVRVKACLAIHDINPYLTPPCRVKLVLRSLAIMLLQNGTCLIKHSAKGL